MISPPLRQEYEGFHRPAVEFINSSVAQFVEVMWRWRAAIDVLVDPREPQDPQPNEDAEAYLARRARDHLVLSRVEAIDPGVRADDPDAAWVQIITDPGY